MSKKNRSISRDSSRVADNARDAQSLKAKSIFNHQLKPLSDDLMPPPPSREELEVPGRVLEAISTIGHALVVNRIRYRESLYIGLGQLVLVADCLASKPPLWEQFCRDEQVEPSDEILSFKAHVLRMVIQCAIPSEKKASKYFCAIRTLFEEETPAEEIPTAIQAGGGIEELARQCADVNWKAKTGKAKSRRPKVRTKIQLSEEMLRALPRVCKLSVVAFFKRIDESQYELIISEASRVR